ncbi:MAG: DUF3710 domain-containing protein [Micrococcales bacterium]|nr:DUF3710 domain-containing protein [Micrococcales bacterium]
MSPLFRRKSRDDQEPEASDGPEEAPKASQDDANDQSPDLGSDSQGPFDLAEQPELGLRLDLGAIRLPVRPGMNVRMDVDRALGKPVAVAVTHDGSTLRLQAFAAPKTSGLWDKVRDELLLQAKQSGGQAEVVEGVFGAEVKAQMPAKGASGQTTKQKMRFIGADGPRWFLRGRITGQAAQKDDPVPWLEEVYRGIVIVRGTEARPPRDLLPLHPPGEVPASDNQSQPAEGATDQIMRRGPEITEIH